MTNDNKNVHKGHRSRLKNRFIENGLDSFEDHNILELLLFYSIPQKDTNDLAHDLINHFGSLKGVFDAEYTELLKVNGIKENSATLIKMIPSIARAYLRSNPKATILNDYLKMQEYLIHTFYGETKELVYALFLNNKFELISADKIFEGSVNSTQINMRKLVELVIKRNAASVVIAHNHPDGSPCPSMEDINTTCNLIDMFRTLDISFIEHFVVTDRACSPIIHNTGSLRSLNEANQDFFNRPPQDTK